MSRDIVGWMIGWTRPSAEFEAVIDLRAEGFEALVPSIRMNRPVKRWTRNRGYGRSYQVESYLSPAFPRYIMFSGPVWQRANRIDGMTLVIRRPGDRDAPAILPQPVAMMLLGDEGDGVIGDLTKTVEAIERFARDQNIVVTNGPFANKPGVVVGHDGRKVRVVLSVLGGERKVWVAPESIRAA